MGSGITLKSNEIEDILKNRGILLEETIEKK